MIIESNVNVSENKNKIIILINNWKVDFRIQSAKDNEYNYFWPLYKNMNKYKNELDNMDKVTLRENLAIDYILNTDNYFCAEDKSFSYVFVSPLALVFVYKNISLIECDLNKKLVQYSTGSLVFFLKAYYKNLIKLMNINNLKQLIKSSLSNKKNLNKKGEYFSFETEVSDIFEIEIYIKKDNYLNLEIEEIMSNLKFDNIINANKFNQIDN